MTNHTRNTTIFFCPPNPVYCLNIVLLYTFLIWPFITFRLIKCLYDFIHLFFYSPHTSQPKFYKMVFLLLDHWKCTYNSQHSWVLSFRRKSTRAHTRCVCNTRKTKNRKCLIEIERKNQPNSRANEKKRLLYVVDII